MNELKLILALASIIMAIIAGLKKEYEWSRHFTLICIIISMGA